VRPIGRTAFSSKRIAWPSRLASTIVSPDLADADAHDLVALLQQDRADAALLRDAR
jgi:hypothetical protein